MTIMRLNKALATAGICSRRKADDLIQEGRVSVNGVTISEMGFKIDSSYDTISVDDENIILNDSASNPKKYIILNKPIQIVSTVYDPENRDTVMSILPKNIVTQRLYPVGRLDYFSEGLLIITNDGDLTHRMTHPKYHLSKIYHVHVREDPTKEQLNIMQSGMLLAEGEKLAPVTIKLEEKNLMVMQLQQGVNRQIRRMCRDIGLTILSLCRVQIGPIKLGILPSGMCRELNSNEVRDLRSAVGLE